MANYTIFDEQYYLAQYPWVKPAIDAGVIQSGREHFEKFG
ncbi:MAG TPA: calcium-binding protein, partial [Phormidium sp.]